MNCDEVMNVIWPQLFQVSDEQLSSSNELPPLLNLSRSCLESTGVYVIFNTFNVYLWVGNQVDGFFLDLLFNVQDQGQLNSLDISEEEVFFGEAQEAKAWVQELYAVIQSLRISQLIYPEFKVLFEIDQKSEILLKEVLHEDANKGIDYNSIVKKLQSGSSPMAMPY
jgi:hypothetical protein